MLTHHRISGPADSITGIPKGFHRKLHSNLLCSKQRTASRMRMSTTQIAPDIAALLVRLPGLYLTQPGTTAGASTMSTLHCSPRCSCLPEGGKRRQHFVSTLCARCITCQGHKPCFTSPVCSHQIQPDERLGCTEHSWQSTSMCKLHGLTEI